MADVGARYRDKVTGVVGVAKDTKTDPEGMKHPSRGDFIPVNLVQLELDECHVNGGTEAGEPQAHQNRWYEEDRLVAAD